jgi:hypothetical protein
MALADGPQFFGKMHREQLTDRGLNPAGPRSQDAGFRAANLLVPRRTSWPSDRPAVPPRLPKFLPPQRFYRFQWKDLLEEFFAFYPTHLKNISVELFRQVPLLPRRFAARPFAASLVVHLLGIPLLPIFFQVIPRHHAIESELLKQHSTVYYHVQKLSPLPHVPKLSPFGPGSAPGIGTPPLQVPTKGASRNLHALFAVSRPHLPDDDHQTILQPQTPDIKIKIDLKLPNLVTKQASPAKPRVQYNPSDVRPLQRKQTDVRADAPKLPGAASPPMAQGLAAVPVVTQARLAVPIGSASAPIIPSPDGQVMDINAAPSFATGGSASGQGFESIAVSRGRVGAPISGSSAPVTPSSRGNGADLGAAPTFDTSTSNSPGLIALSTEPGGPAEMVALPPGNRHGQFSIAPDISGPGSPGGEVASISHGGAGGNGPGGNESTGVGKGTYSGGGGTSGTLSAFISLRGNNTGDRLLPDPGPATTAQMVYPLPASALIRHNMLVVSAGPIGGGGSNVYGELPCGKIYTVFLPTGGKQWSLQYCQKSETPAATENHGRSTVVHAELPILPPEAKESYEFQRLPLPSEKAHKFIILRGAISDDGTVEHVEVHQGLYPPMDAAARLAFSQWKFKPAMRSGKPVRVEILVAIPGDPPKPK